VTTNTTIGGSGTTVSQQLMDTMNGTSSSSSSSSSAANPSSAASLQTTFLQLLVTQLQNQDPTNPADSSQMTSQLAQISTALSSLSSQLSAGTSAQSASLIGKSVLAPGNTVTVASGAATNFGVDSTSALTDLQVSITNSSGVVVNTLDLGAVPAGVTPLNGWTPVDSTGKTLPDGSYTITATGSLNGTSEATTALSASTVQNVIAQADGTTGLTLSNGETVPLTSVASIY
jgi:flagellar basal-body rod modification protein FlgD